MGERSPAQRSAYLKELAGHRERLSAAIADTRNAGTSGVKKVLQRPDGAMVCSKTSYWTYNIGEAYAAGEHSYSHPEARVTPTEVARTYLMNLMKADLSILENRAAT